jgi:hypothetical protein
MSAHPPRTRVRGYDKMTYDKMTVVKRSHSARRSSNPRCTEMPTIYRISQLPPMFYVSPPPR